MNEWRLVEHFRGKDGTIERHTVAYGSFAEMQRVRQEQQQKFPERVWDIQRNTIGARKANAY